MLEALPEAELLGPPRPSRAPLSTATPLTPEGPPESYLGVAEGVRNEAPRRRGRPQSVRNDIRDKVKGLYIGKQLPPIKQMMLDLKLPSKQRRTVERVRKDLNKNAGT
jgi:hypothetical protein